MDDFFSVLLSACFLVLILYLFLSFFLGRDARAQMAGTLAADVVRFLFLAPFRLIAWLAKKLFT